MKFGVCGSMISNDLRLGGVEVVESIAILGFDYIELSLAHLTDLPEPDFKAVISRIKDAGLSCECCNNFFPPSIRLTGPDVNFSQIEEYTKKALARAKDLGAEVVVFGSGVAKTYPESFSKDEAYNQLLGICSLLDPIATENAIIVAIEPLQKSECNLINTAFEGMQLVRQVASENIQLLVDYFHLLRENEDPDIILKASEFIKHIHFAKIDGRSFPVDLAEDKCYGKFFQNLNKIKYNKRISIEAYTSDFTNDASKALLILKQIVQNSGEHL